MSDAALIARDVVVIAQDYGQFTVSAVASDSLALIETALASPPSASDGRTVLVLSPHQNNFEMGVDLEVWSSRPADDRTEWDQVSEDRLTVGETGVVIESPTLDGQRFSLEPGEYLVEVSGRGFIAVGWPGTTTPGDTWRIRFWPGAGQTPRAAMIWNESS